ncbi:MAG TPA: hypothetical protein VMZ00_17320 [Sporichthya sp.]|nr:hypothetical protein [Sporichthya sp.]
MRLALLCIPGLAIIVALAVARAQRSPSRPLAVAGVAAVLLPLATITPTTLRVVAWPEPPAFIAAHQWRDYVRPGGTLAVFPVPSQSWLAPLHWEVVENLGFAIPGGHFAGPDAGGRWGQYGAPARAATQLIDQVRTTGVVPAVDDSTRDAFVRDLWYWQADAVVIRPDESEDVVRRTINLLLGTAGERVGGLLVWRVPVIRTSSGEAR